MLKQQELRQIHKKINNNNVVKNDTNSSILEPYPFEGEYTMTETVAKAVRIKTHMQKWNNNNMFKDDTTNSITKPYPLGANYTRCCWNMKN